MGKGYEQKSQGDASTSNSMQQKKTADAERSIDDFRPETTTQRKLQEIMQGGVPDASQRKIAPGFSEPVQGKGPEDEEKLMQGKFILQREATEEEEPLSA